MNDITGVINLVKYFDYNEIIILCNKITSYSGANNYDDTLNFIEEVHYIDLINIMILDTYTKQKSFEEFYKLNQQLNFSCIEDWKNEEKICSTLLLIVLKYINTRTLHKIIGNQSKKTYRDGTIIDDNSLALKKFFNDDYKKFRKQFYNNLDIIIKIIAKDGIETEIIEKTVYSMIDIIQADIICRNKYTDGDYYNYKNKISDIVETREKEDKMYYYFNITNYRDLTNAELNEPLKFILLNTWDDTKINHLWLTELITFINNNNPNCKDYLVNNVGIKMFFGTDYKTKCNVIQEVIRKKKLNLTNIKQAVDFIFSIGTYYKHKTYNKWYSKELNAINLFDKHKEFDLDEILQQKLINSGLNISPNSEQLMSLMSNYYINLLNKFS